MRRCLSYRPVALLTASCAFCGCLETPPLVPLTVDEDLDLPAVELNASRFHLVRDGVVDGVPILFLAGGPGNDARYLRRLGEPCEGRGLGDTHPLYFWDQRGTGRSRRHRDELLRLHVFEADLDALVDHIDPARTGVILVGHSWGGMLATSYINRHPARVVGAVLIEPGEYAASIWRAWESQGGPSASVSFPLSAEWLNDFAWSGQLLTPHDHAAIDFSALIAAQGAQPERVNRESAPIGRLGGAVLRQSLLGNFYPVQFDFTDHLHMYTTEVLVIAGDTPSSDLGAAFQRYQLGVFPVATLEVIPGAGHTDVVWADACVTLGYVEAYLERLGVQR